MNGVHDMGGLQCFGPIGAETDEPLFHHAWERRAFALTLAMGASGKWNIDTSRATRESLPAARYLASSYYEIWLDGLIALMLNTQLVTSNEVETGRLDTPAVTTARVLHAENVLPILMSGSPYARPVSSPARFKVGDSVTTRQLNPTTHTRLPRYCRAKPGIVAAVRGVHVFPDTNAVGAGEQPQWLYTIRFDAHDLWGSDTTAAAVCVDCWETYLEATPSCNAKH